MEDAKNNVNIGLKDRNGFAEKKLLILNKMRHYKEPVSMYKVAKDLNSSTSGVYYHFNQLVSEKIIFITDKKRYVINPTFKYIGSLIEKLTPFIEIIANINPDFNEDELSNLISYIFAILSIEVENE